jgi:hypothetical protein
VSSGIGFTVGLGVGSGVGSGIGGDPFSGSAVVPGNASESTSAPVMQPININAGIINKK